MQKIQSVLQYQDAEKNLNWINTLSEMGELEALAETRRRLAKMDFSDDNNLKNKIDLTLEIDKNSYRNVKKITHKYLNLSKSIKTKIKRRTSQFDSSTLFKCNVHDG